jgi:hypothetical protein
LPLRKIVPRISIRFWLKELQSWCSSLRGNYWHVLLGLRVVVHNDNLNLVVVVHNDNLNLVRFVVFNNDRIIVNDDRIIYSERVSSEEDIQHEAEHNHSRAHSHSRIEPRIERPASSIISRTLDEKLILCVRMAGCCFHRSVPVTIADPLNHDPSTKYGTLKQR